MQQYSHRAAHQHIGHVIYPRHEKNNCHDQRKTLIHQHGGIIPVETQLPDKCHENEASLERKEIDEDRTRREGGGGVTLEKKSMACFVRC